MIPALVRRGFGYGSGMIDPGRRRFLLNIPKNASSYMLDWSNRHGWNSALIDNHSDVDELIVVLRDPLQRWVSGLAQYIRSYILSVYGPNGPIFPGEPITKHDYVMTGEKFCSLYNDLTERLLFDVIDAFDDHVWPQHQMIPKVLPHVKKTFFFMDHTFDQSIGGYLEFAPMTDLDRNCGSVNHDTAQVQEFLQQRLLVRPELAARIKNHYREDYDLISRAFSV
jgi:hypothetical protein